MRTHLLIKCLGIVTLMMLLLSCQPKTGNPTDQKSSKTMSFKDMKPNQSGYANVNGLKMYYEVYGKGEPIVLLHGAFMTIPLNWSGFIPLLAKNRQVIVAEMQGHGRTQDINRAITAEGMADDVSGLLKYLKVNKADILGYSMGGGIAFQFAIRHPDQLRKLVILSGTYAHDGWWPEGEASFASINADMFKDTPIKKQYDSLGKDPAHFPEFVKKVMASDAQPYDWSKEVKKIKAPIFLVIGDMDGVRYEHALDLFRTKGGGKMGDMHGLPPSRLAILPGTTHVGMTQRAEWLVPMINEFLNASPDPTPPPSF
ncbi:alpha/beta fold hydrolase [Chryseobacterium sp. PMSZPI]|uniref:alpha/beta fold hydrolase n=1 Tax=Chryseobacterium sp. PMSZPI TaxID=1033900 RepID=UPI0039A2EAB1